MIFYFLILIVFIAEIIITVAILLHLLKIDRCLIELNIFVTEANPKIKELAKTIRQLSEQLMEYAPIVKEMVKRTVMNIIMGQIKNAVGALTFLLVKKEIEKHV